MKQSLIFLGYCVDKKISHSLSGISITGNNMQLSILKQLYKNEKFHIDCFSVYPVAAFPKDSKWYYSQTQIPVFDDLTSCRVAFINLPVIKQISQIFSLYRNAKALLCKHPNAIIFTFNMFPQTGLPAYYLRKKFPDCLLIAFMADLPIEDTPNRRVLGKCLRKLFNRIAEKLVTVADKLVVLNKNAAEVCAPETPYTVVEGGVNTEDASPNIISVAKREKIIVYSGKLIGYNGIMELMQSMNLVTCRNVKLHIYGDGPLKETISACAEKTDKIEYMGLVENDTMKRIQREAYLLINPRPVDDPIAMVTFPSKIFEYLISGTPVLTTRLNGFTNEYFDKMFFTESNAPAELACKIDEIMAMPFDALDSMAQNAKNFVMKEKNWSKQMQKIIEFIEKG